VVWWTGLGGATPLGGQARIRSHRTESVGGWESTGHYEDSTTGVRQPVIGSGSHPDLCGVLEMCERFSCDVAFQAAHDLSGVLPFFTSASDIRLGPGVL